MGAIGRDGTDGRLDKAHATAAHASQSLSAGRPSQGRANANLGLGLANADRSTNTEVDTKTDGVEGAGSSPGSESSPQGRQKSWAGSNALLLANSEGKPDV